MARTTLAHQGSLRRAVRTRAKLAENQTLPRLSVHRTLRYIYAQVIDDATGKTLATASDKVLDLTGTKTERATKVGEAIAAAAKKAGVQAVRFDRGAFRYHGRVAALAEGARKAGLTF